MQIGFIGLGNVGGKLAGSLLRNGFDLMVRDLDSNVAAPLLENGATWSETPKEMAETVDMVITCLPSPAASASVMEADDGIMAGLSEGKIWLEMSTTDETESQVILNGSYNINFTMDLVVKDMMLFENVAGRTGVPLEISPKILNIFKDGQDRYGPRAWSSMIVKRLEDACGVDLRAPGFPRELVGTEPEAPGAEVIVTGHGI